MLYPIKKYQKEEWAKYYRYINDGYSYINTELNYLIVKPRNGINNPDFYDLSYILTGPQNLVDSIVETGTEMVDTRTKFNNIIANIEDEIAAGEFVKMYNFLGNARKNWEIRNNWSVYINQNYWVDNNCLEYLYYRYAYTLAKFIEICSYKSGNECPMEEYLNKDIISIGQPYYDTYYRGSDIYQKYKGKLKSLYTMYNKTKGIEGAPKSLILGLRGVFEEYIRELLNENDSAITFGEMWLNTNSLAEKYLGPRNLDNEFYRVVEGLNNELIAIQHGAIIDIDNNKFETLFETMEYIISHLSKGEIDYEYDGQKIVRSYYCVQVNKSNCNNIIPYILKYNQQMEKDHKYVQERKYIIDKHTIAFGETPFETNDNENDIRDRIIFPRLNLEYLNGRAILSKVLDKISKDCQEKKNYDKLNIYICTDGYLADDVEELVEKLKEMAETGRYVEADIVGNGESYIFEQANKKLTPHNRIRIEKFNKPIN